MYKYGYFHGDLRLNHSACHVPTFPNVFAMIGGLNGQWTTVRITREYVEYVEYVVNPPANGQLVRQQPWTAEMPLDGWELEWN